MVGFGFGIEKELFGFKLVCCTEIIFCQMIVNKYIYQRSNT